MFANQQTIRRRPTPPATKRNRRFFAAALAAAFGAAALLLVVPLAASCRAASAPLEISVNAGLQTIRVPAGGSLQAALDVAQSGDLIELAAGASYAAVVLPNRPLTDYVTVKSSAAGQLPDNVRVGPGGAGSMAKILAGADGSPAVSAAAGAHHYRFVGIEFAPSNGSYVYNLINFTSPTSRLADVPHDLEIDRCYLRSIAAGVTRRGVALNSANTVVKNSYFAGFAYPQQETQGIAGWTGTKNVRIQNNYIEGGAENIMFGGSDPAAAELIPNGIEVSGNELNKPAAWRNVNAMKCLFELKNAKNVRFVGNRLTNNWLGAAFRVTVRNQDGAAPFSTIEDVLIKDNVIDGTGEGINILGKDDTYPSQTLKRLSIMNNTFLNLGGPQFEGSGYFIQIADGEDIQIAHNTTFNLGNIVTFYGAAPRGFLFRNNICGHGNYGIHGLSNLNGAAPRRLFRNNLFVNNRQVPPSDLAYPRNNFLVQSFTDVGFADLQGGDLRLGPGAKYKAEGTDQAAVGSNLQTGAIK